MSALAPLFSSEKRDWTTPGWLFDLLDAEFRFTLDAAASDENTKVPDRYYTEADDGLAQPWEGTVWCNPPYGRGVGEWVRKGYQSAQAGATVVMLLPARTDTRWWNEYVSYYDWAARRTVMVAHEVRFLRGRLRFGGAKAGAPFPSAVVVWLGRREVSR